MKTVLAGTIIKRVKVGVKPEKEALATTQVKSGEKRVKAKSTTHPILKSIHPFSGQAKQYKAAVQSLKKNRVIHLIQHPHERVMDRIIDYERAHLTLEQEKIEALRELRNKFYREDQEAYKKIVDLIHQLW